MMETEENFLTLREAASLLKVTHQAIRSRARHRGVKLTEAPGVHGIRYLLHKNDLERLRDGFAERSRKTVSSVAGDGDGTVSQNPFVEPSRETVPSSNTSLAVPHVVHLEALRMLENAHSELRRLERQSTALGCELQLYRQSISENAASIAEREAFRLQAQALEAEKEALEESLRLQAKALEEENRERLERWESEKAQLTEQLRATSSRVVWLEKRVPTWVRKLFGAV